MAMAVCRSCTPLFSYSPPSSRTPNIHFRIPPPLFNSIAVAIGRSTLPMGANKIRAIRRRRSYFQSDTYVLMEPGRNEEFVSEEELRIRLKAWLQNWPGHALPRDLSQFETIDDAVSHLVKSVCELEVDGEVGSIQWYQVRLE